MVELVVDEVVELVVELLVVELLVVELLVVELLVELVVVVELLRGLVLASAPVKNDCTLSVSSATMITISEDRLARPVPMVPGVLLFSSQERRPFRQPG